jgi:WD40 repeat protein
VTADARAGAAPEPRGGGAGDPVQDGDAGAPEPRDGGAGPLPADGGQVDHDNPWPGLPSFREQDQELFFGREAETEALRRVVMRESTRATVLFGRSGLGKTSLLQAGLFPRLRRQEVLPVAIRLAYGGERGLVAQVREAILAAAAEAGVEAPAFPADETLWESFHRAGANFWSASNRIVVPLLAFDQFEEIFTLGKKDSAGREAFLTELADLVEGRPPAAVKARLDGEPALAAGFSPERHDYKVLLSLRQDFLADLRGLRGRMRSLGTSELALLHMNGEAALRVVTRAGGHLIDPEVAEKVVRFVSGAGRRGGAGAGASGAESAGAESSGGASGGAEPDGAASASAAGTGSEAPRTGSADARDAGSVGGGSAQAEPRADAGGGPDAPAEQREDGGGSTALAELEVDPTLLSLICRELNNRRRERGQAKITFDLLSGSWKEILTRFYENSLAGLGPAVRAFVEDRLLTRSGYRDSVAWDNAVSTPGVSAADLLELRDRRLLRFEERHGTDWIELTHDVLTEVIGESRELRRQREARLRAEDALREADERERQARAREREAHQRERQTRKLLARSRKLAVVLGAVLLLAITMGALGAWLWKRSEAAERAAESAQRRAERALFDSAGNLIEKGRGAQALAYLAAIMRSNPRNSWAARSRALDALVHDSWALPLRVVRHERAVTWAELSRDGERLLTASTDGTARLWRVRDGAGLGVMRHRDAVTWASFSPDGSRVLTASKDGTARIWDGRNAAPIGRPMQHGSRVLQAAWSRAGDRILTSSYRELRLWNAGTQERAPGPGGAQASFSAPSAFMVPLAALSAFSPDGRQLVVLESQGTASFLDLRTGARAGELPPAGEALMQAAFNHRGDRLLTVDTAGAVRIWDRAARRVLFTREHKSLVTWAEFSPDDHGLLTMGGDRVVRLWNLDVPGPPVTLQHDRGVVAAHYSPDGRWVLTGSRDGAARLWDVRSGELAAQPLLHAAPLESVSFSHDGLRAVTAADDGAAKVWDLRVTYARPQQLPEAVGMVLFAGEGRQVVAVLRDGTARLWDLATGASTALLLGKRQVMSVTQLADGRLAAVFRDPGSRAFRAWDARTGKPASAAIEDPAGLPLFLAWVSADAERVLGLRLRGGIDVWDARSGRRIAGLTDDKGEYRIGEDGRLILGPGPAGVRIWDTRTGSEVGGIGQRGAAWADFGAGGRLILVLGADRVLRLFDAASRKPVGAPQPMDGRPTGVDFSRDAKRMAATSGDGEVKVSEVENGKVLCRLHVHSLADPLDAEARFTARISADGKRVLSRSPEGWAQVWDVEACQQVGEPLWQPGGWVREARFSADGSRILTIDGRSFARVWEVPETTPADSAPLADLAEAVAGFAVDASGNAVPIDDPVGRLERLRAASARAGNGHEEGSLTMKVMRWLFADPAARTLSPFVNVKAPAAGAGAGGTAAGAGAGDAAAGAATAGAGTGGSAAGPAAGPAPP